MPSSVDTTTFSLSKPVSSEALVALRRDVALAVDGECRAVVVDVDDVGILDSRVISTLVSILRRARERGAAVSLRASRKNILDTLRVTGLDKVFIVTAAPASRPVAVAPIRGHRSVAAVVAGVFALASLFGTRASAASDASAGDLVRNVIAQNAAMRSYEAQVSVDLHLRSFPYASQHLEGATYFKRPGSFEVVFTKVPSYAKGFEKLYSDADDPTSWEKRFDLTLAGDRTIGGHRDAVVRLVQKVRGMIDHEDVAIDPATWRIDSMEWHYYNGGTIAMDQEYQRVGPFTVLAKQHATIRIPFVHAAADAVYSDYRTNVTIDDSVFTRDKHE